MKDIKKNSKNNRNKSYKHQLKTLIFLDHGSKKERIFKHNKQRKNGQNNSIHKT